MEKIYTLDSIRNVPERSFEKLKSDFLSSDSVLFRSMAAVQIGLQMGDYFSRNSKALLDEIKNDIHKDGALLGVKSLWTILVVLAENLRESDYHKLRNAFMKLDEEDRLGLLEWLSRHPTHINILKNGSSN
jgi:hypothetical protein